MYDLISLYASNTWILSMILWMFCIISIFFLTLFFKQVGLYTYIVLASLGSNIQVLKFSYFPGILEPLPLGTIFFTTTNLALHFLLELYGSANAKKSIFLSFSALFIWNTLMYLTIMYPASSSKSEIQNAMTIIFLPQVSLFVASVIAYMISQFCNIILYTSFDKFFNHSHLWIRNNLSSIIASLVDHFIFTLLIFGFFAIIPLLSWNRIIFEIMSKTKS